MFTKKSMVMVLCMFISASVLFACASTPAEQAEQRDRIATGNQMDIYTKNQPVPPFEYSQDRDALIQIYTMKNESRITYTVITSDGTGDVLFSCPSIGYAIPADTQLTNPLKYEWTSQGPAVIEQAEPNGLYSSKNTDGTYVLCVRPNGDITPLYTESKVTTFPFAVTIEGNRVKEVPGSVSTLKIELNPPPGAKVPTIQVPNSVTNTLTLTPSP